MGQCSGSWEPCVVSGELQWVLGLSQGLAGSVVLHVEGCVPPTPAAAASLQELVLEFLRGARGPKPYVALGHSRKNVAVK